MTTAPLSLIYYTHILKPENGDTHLHKHTSCKCAVTTMCFSISIRLFVMSSPGGLSLTFYYNTHTLRRIWHCNAHKEERVPGHMTSEAHAQQRQWSMYAVAERMVANRFIHSKVLFLVEKNPPFCAYAHKYLQAHTHTAGSMAISVNKSRLVPAFSDN